MDEILLRFGHLGNQILVGLDCQSVANAKQVSRSWNEFIEEETLVEFTAMKQMTKASGASIRKVIKKSNAPEFAKNVCQLYHVWNIAQKFGDPVCWNFPKFPMDCSPSVLKEQNQDYLTVKLTLFEQKPFEMIDQNSYLHMRRVTQLRECPLMTPQVFDQFEFLPTYLPYLTL